MKNWKESLERKKRIKTGKKEKMKEIRKRR